MPERNFVIILCGAGLRWTNRGFGAMSYLLALQYAAEMGDKKE